MKKIILLIVIISSLTSCSDFINIRVKTIKDNDIIFISADRSLLKGYKEGDTIQIKLSSGGWEIENNIQVRDTLIPCKDDFIQYRKAIISEISKE